MLMLILYTLNSGLSPNYSPHRSPLCCTITRFPCALLTLPVVCCYLEIPTRTLTHTCAVLCTSVFLESPYGCILVCVLLLLFFAESLLFFSSCHVFSRTVMVKRSLVSKCTEKKQQQTKRLNELHLTLI